MVRIGPESGNHVARAALSATVIRVVVKSCLPPLLLIVAISVSENPASSISSKCSVFIARFRLPVLVIPFLRNFPTLGDYSPPRTENRQRQLRGDSSLFFQKACRRDECFVLGV